MHPASIPAPRLHRFVIGTFLWAASLAVTAHSSEPKVDVLDLVKSTGIQGGFFVHLGTENATLPLALQANPSIQVHGLAFDSSRVPLVRQEISAADRYGPVSIDYFDDETLPYVDNLVNLLVADSTASVSEAEILRVLVPEGIAFIRQGQQWKTLRKPRPENIDEWTHYLHDASGNSVAHDDVVAPPRHLQWVGSPRWSRHHDRMASMSALVSSGGRMFYIMDEGSRVSIQLPPKWKLIARDAFNGSILWKKDIDEWQPHLWPLKSGPSQLTRRLVARDNKVYVTLGFNAPLMELDAATGEVLQTFGDSDATEEIICTEDTVYTVVRKGRAELEDYKPLHGTVGDQARSRDFFWNEEPRVLMAFDRDSGKQLWAKQTKISPLTLAADGKNIFFHDTQRVISLGGRNGNLAWETDPVSRRQSFTFNFGPRLVVYEDVVLYAGGDGNMVSCDSATGEKLWDAQFPNSGYQSPQDLMVVDGLVWLAPLTSGKDSGVYTGRDPRTGKVIRSFAPDVDTYWFHHRCYIAKATDNFLIPSRTGVEFVDPKAEHWDIHHWVRGGCLYGVMPCNGLTYTPPHNCACYPEAKLFGFNALAPTAPTRPIPTQVDETGRLEEGPAYGAALLAEAESDNWATYRHDANRSGTSPLPVPAKVQPLWQFPAGGRLTAPVISGGQVYVAQVDAHTLHAIDEATGKARWSFTIGGRIDSPPTIARGRVVFGGADGWVYALTEDGKLAWRYRAAPHDRRTMAFEQLESLWPVHGSVLIQDDTVWCVAGRSNFLDGGLRVIRLDLASGKKLSETIMDETNPATGNNLQEKLQVLQMPVGLPDILSFDGEHVFMKSQKFNLEGERLEIGPNSGDFASQASKQRGPDAHIFAPMGFLDDSWFHRSYWVHGQSFAGGHGGYYQAGRFAPSGRILVKGNGYVFGYGRKPQYLRWTTKLEHQLFAAEPSPPEIPDNFLRKKNSRATAAQSVTFETTPSLNPTNKPITVEAWISTTKPQGTIIARGGPAEGFALTLKGGKPEFHIRSKGKLTTIAGTKRIIGGWHHVAGVLLENKSMQLYVDGELSSEGTASGLIASDPAQGMDIGADAATSVGDYPAPLPFSGAIDEVRLYFTAATAEQIKARFTGESEIGPNAVVAIGFDDGTARDHSLHRNDGNLVGGKPIDGKIGKAIQFSTVRRKNGAGAIKPGDSLVQPKWTQDVNIYVRGMVLAGDHLFIVGPKDIMDEEITFDQLAEDDPSVHRILAEQDALLEGESGSQLLVVNPASGETLHDLQLDSLPTWDGLAAANNKLFLTTQSGEVICLGTP